MKEIPYLLKLIRNLGRCKMQLLTQSLKKQLNANYHANEKAQYENKGEIDFAPVVKLFSPVGAATWLITEMDDEGMMFGLCDMGHGFPELGHVHHDELANIKLLGGALGIERDIHWKAKSTINEYAKQANLNGRIVA
jgi:hypothetical protein